MATTTSTCQTNQINQEYLCVCYLNFIVGYKKQLATDQPFTRNEIRRLQVKLEQDVAKYDKNSTSTRGAFHGNDKQYSRELVRKIMDELIASTPKLAVSMAFQGLRQWIIKVDEEESNIKFTVKVLKEVADLYVEKDIADNSKLELIWPTTDQKQLKSIPYIDLYVKASLRLLHDALDLQDLDFLSRVIDLVIVELARIDLRICDNYGSAIFENLKSIIQFFDEPKSSEEFMKVDFWEIGYYLFDILSKIAQIVFDGKDSRAKTVLKSWRESSTFLLIKLENSKSRWGNFKDMLESKIAPELDFFLEEIGKESVRDEKLTG